VLLTILFRVGRSLEASDTVQNIHYSNPKYLYVIKVLMQKGGFMTKKCRRPAFPRKMYHGIHCTFSENIIRRKPIDTDESCSRLKFSLDIQHLLDFVVKKYAKLVAQRFAIIAFVVCSIFPPAYQNVASLDLAHLPGNSSLCYNWKFEGSAGVCCSSVSKQNQVGGVQQNR
jgi:hypothetical protein